MKVKYHNICRICGALFWTKDAFRIVCYKHSQAGQLVEKKKQIDENIKNGFSLIQSNN